jgi:hypothetical protein
MSSIEFAPSRCPRGRAGDVAAQAGDEFDVESMDEEAACTV